MSGKDFFGTVPTFMGNGFTGWSHQMAAALMAAGVHYTLTTTRPSPIQPVLPGVVADDSAGTR